MGAFDFGPYRKGMDGRNDIRLGGAILSIKAELIYNGYDQNVNPDLAFFGDAISNRVKEFQADRGLTSDGQVGARTALELFHARVGALEKKYNLPTDALGKQVKLESAFDPAAKGVIDSLDTGISQINLGQHPDVTEVQAYSAAWALEWTCQHIRGSYNNIADDVHVMRAARAAYNIGDVYAAQWLEAGFPSSGGPSIGGQDSFTRATQYLQLIDSQAY